MYSLRFSFVEISPTFFLKSSLFLIILKIQQEKPEHGSTHQKPCFPQKYILSKSSLKVMALTPEIGIDSCSLPGDFHKNPADRIIVATARVLQCFESLQFSKNGIESVCCLKIYRFMNSGLLTFNIWLFFFHSKISNMCIYFDGL